MAEQIRTTYEAELQNYKDMSKQREEGTSGKPRTGADTQGMVGQSPCAPLIRWSGPSHSTTALFSSYFSVTYSVVHLK